jgi:hypothetical protein
MKHLAVLGMALIGLTVQAEAKSKSCSGAKASCAAINAKSGQGADGAARCEQYFQACLQTGTWSSRQGTISGYTKN